MADACDIRKGYLARLKSGKCPQCLIGLFGQFGPNGVPEPLSDHSCPHCGFNFKEIFGVAEREKG